MPRRNTTGEEKPRRRAETVVPTLLPAHAFVVQFRMTADLASDRWEGRVEHVVSDQATLFHSQQELLAFLTHVWTQVRSAEKI